MQAYLTYFSVYLSNVITTAFSLTGNYFIYGLCMSSVIKKKPIYTSER